MGGVNLLPGELSRAQIGYHARLTRKGGLVKPLLAVARALRSRVDAQGLAQRQESRGAVRQCLPFLA